MKIVLIGVLLLIASPILVFGQTNRNDKTANELMQLERDWVTATLKRDKAWLERFFADDFISTHPTSGTIKNKAQEIADTIDDAQTPDSMTLGEMKVIVAGKTAVVTGTAFETGGVHKLEDRNRGYLFTDTFVKRGGRWQLLASHSSRLPESEISAQEREETEKYIRESEAQWAKSVATGDASALERILADDFVGVDPKGNFYDKAQMISDTREAPKYFVSNRLDEVKIRFYGKTIAVAQGSETWERRDGKRGRFVWTDTWIRRNGRWQIVAAEDLTAAAK